MPKQRSKAEMAVYQQNRRIKQKRAAQDDPGLNKSVTPDVTPTQKQCNTPTNVTPKPVTPAICNTQNVTPMTATEVIQLRKEAGERACKGVLSKQLPVNMEALRDAQYKEDAYALSDAIKRQLKQSEQTITPHDALPSNYGLPNCACMHCQSNRVNGGKHIINHGTPKPADQLAANELNRVASPGDVDYIGNNTLRNIKCEPILIDEVDLPGEGYIPIYNGMFNKEGYMFRK